MDPDLFFDNTTVDQAKRLCSSCDVRERCLEYALEENIKYGIFGGLDAKERRKLKRRRRNAA